MANPNDIITLNVAVSGNICNAAHEIKTLIEEGKGITAPEIMLVISKHIDGRIDVE